LEIQQYYEKQVTLRGGHMLGGVKEGSYEGGYGE
jgi:hypothetical protein